MIDWNTPRYLDLPDLRMAIFEAGEARADCPSVVLCHGWPEIAYSWRHIVAPLVAAGFHVIVPDQRGYGFTGKALSDDGTAASVPLYDMQHLCDDMAHLLDALDLPQAVFVGHDWGGIMMWQLPFYHVDRIAGLIGVNTPFIPRLTADPIESFRTALGDDFYICVFQDYGRAEKIMDANITKTLRTLYRGAGSDKGSDKDSDATPTPPPAEHAKLWENFELVKIIEQVDEADLPGKLLFNEEDFAYYEAAFAKSGFRGGINWYRNFSRNWEASADFEQKIDIPSLMISAADDRILSPAMAEGMPKYVSDLQMHTIKDCGHWTQNEKPQELAALMTDWLSRFSPAAKA